MFSKDDEDGYTELVPGISIKTLVYGRNTLTAKFKLKKGSSLPMHSHPHEQTGYLISGKMEFVIAGEQHTAEPGDIWCIGGDIDHSAEVLEESVVIEVFSPVREDYLPKIQ
ncbi:MAG: cupin domain-containing protein [Desulfocapsaceae bacterium]|nr:cupin domain-containing protein [Desulfocapsaceae bacterium]